MDLPSVFDEPFLRALLRGEAVEPDGVAVARILDEGASYLAVVTSGDIWLAPVRTLQTRDRSLATLGVAEALR